MLRRPRRPTQHWKTFLKNHTGEIAAIDFFAVPTATCRILYCLVVLRHDRRRVVHFNVSANPTSMWISQQLVEAFPYDNNPRFLLRDRDGQYGDSVVRRIRSLNIQDTPTAPRAPWQNAYVERLIGSIRRECLDHVIVLSELHLKRILQSYLEYYHHSRTHLSLDRNSPDPRRLDPPVNGEVIAIAKVGGLHHEDRRAA